MKIIIETDTGELIELPKIEAHLTKLFKTSLRKNVTPERKREAEYALSCYLQAFRALSKTDLQILWYLKNTPFDHGLVWRVEEILRKQYEASCSLKNLDDFTPCLPFQNPSL